MRDHCSDAKRAVIRYDSKYAAKTVQGIFNGDKNIKLYKKIRDIYQEVKQTHTVIFSHVKGHSNHRWNDMVDAMAKRGAGGTTCCVGRYAESIVGTPCEEDK